jgi:hypothetical protein
MRDYSTRCIITIRKDTLKNVRRPVLYELHHPPTPQAQTAQCKESYLPYGRKRVK